MARRLLAIFPILLTLAFGAEIATATAPPGPRLAIVKLRAHEGTELFTVDAAGKSRAVLYAAGPRRIPAVYPFMAPAWSPDGTRVAFTATTGWYEGGYVSFPRTTIALVSEDGGAVEPVPGTAGAVGPVFSPDGHQIAFAKERKRWKRNDKGGVNVAYESGSIWIVDLAGGAPRQLTPWRNQLLQYPTSFSPDGARLAFSRLDGAKAPEAIEMGFDGSAESVIARNALDPVYSPDGRRIAFLRGPSKTIVKRSRDENSSTVSVTWARLTDIFVRDAIGGGLRRLTKTPRAAEAAPSWDPSGQRLAYTEFKPFGPNGASLGFGSAIREVNADGTCPRTVITERISAHYAAAWQPGIGREAGPIVC